MKLDIGIQVLISLLSILSVALAYWPGRDLRLYGALAGLMSQPFWIWMIFSQGLWGIAPLTPVYSIMYIMAVRSHWMAS